MEEEEEGRVEVEEGRLEIILQVPCSGINRYKLYIETDPCSDSADMTKLPLRAAQPATPPMLSPWRYAGAAQSGSAAIKQTKK